MHDSRAVVCEVELTKVFHMNTDNDCVFFLAFFYLPRIKNILIWLEMEMTKIIFVAGILDSVIQFQTRCQQKASQGHFPSTMEKEISTCPHLKNKKP